MHTYYINVSRKTDGITKQKICVAVSCTTFAYAIYTV